MHGNISGSRISYFNKKVLFVGGILFFCCLFFYLFSGICFPFMVGFILAYLCEPLVSFLSRFVNRALLGLILALCSIFLFILIGYKILPYITEYVEWLASNAPVYYDKFMTFLDNNLASVNCAKYNLDIAGLKSEIQKFLDQKIYILGSLVKEIALNSKSITGFFSFFVIMPISFFYFVKDWEILTDSIYKCIPNRQKNAVTEAFCIIRKTFTDFFHGQFYVVTGLSVYYILLLGMVGIEGSIGLGIVSGLFSFIPFIGAVFSVVLVLFFSVSSLTITKIYIVLATYLVGQVLEGYVLSPKFVGRKTGLHPLWILFSFFAGIQLLGILGVLIAAPLAAVIRNLIRFAIRKFRATQAYKQ